MGPTCARKSGAQAGPAHERDLFGYDLDKAAAAAQHRVQVHIETLTVEALMVTRADFRAARVRLGVWAGEGAR